MLSPRQEGVMDTNSTWCRAISFLDKLAGSAVYSCMLMESVFLHRLIAAAFKGEPKLRHYYCVAAGRMLSGGTFVAAKYAVAAY
jgi:hypothetical protein